MTFLSPMKMIKEFAIRNVTNVQIKSDGKFRLPITHTHNLLSSRWGVSSLSLLNVYITLIVMNNFWIIVSDPYFISDKICVWCFSRGSQKLGQLLSDMLILCCEEENGVLRSPAVVSMHYDPFRSPFNFNQQHLTMILGINMIWCVQEVA